MFESLTSWDGVAGDAADDRAEARFGVVADDVVYEDAAECLYLCAFFGAAQTGAQSGKKRGAVRMLRMVMLEMVMSSQRAPSSLSRARPSGAVEDAVGDGNVFEAAIGLGAAFDAAGARTWASGAGGLKVP